MTAPDLTAAIEAAAEALATNDGLTWDGDPNKFHGYRFDAHAALSAALPALAETIATHIETYGCTCDASDYCKGMATAAALVRALGAVDAETGEQA